MEPDHDHRHGEDVVEMFTQQSPTPSCRPCVAEG